LVRAGPPELQLYARDDSPRWRPRPTPVMPAVLPPSRPPPPRPAPPPARPAPAPVRSPPPAPPPPAPTPPLAKTPPASELVTTTEPLVLHLEALQLMERGADRDAMVVLDELVLAAPQYVAGLLERA